MVSETHTNKSVNVADNPYYREFQQLKDMGSNRQLTWGGQRKQLTEEYAWAIPNKKALVYIAEESPLIEIGSGNGYWASQISACGGLIDCYDVSPPTDDETEWHPVNNGSDDVLHTMSPDATLFLCWPPANNPMAEQCLQKKPEESDVIFVGEHYNNHSGCVTGTEAFHDLLSNDYECIKTIDIPQWPTSTDKLYHFTPC